MKASGIMAAPFASIFLILTVSTAIQNSASVGLRVFLPTLPPYCGDGRAFVVQVLADGSMRLNSESITSDQLATRLHDLFRTRAERLAFLEADSVLPFGKVVELIDLTQGEAKYVGLITPSIQRELRHQPINCLTIHP